MYASCMSDALYRLRIVSLVVECFRQVAVTLLFIHGGKLYRNPSAKSPDQSEYGYSCGTRTFRHYLGMGRWSN